jgi:DNA-binding CsgD family transcriptional regulator
MAMIDTTRSGAIGTMTARAQALLERYFPTERCSRLPTILLRWLQAHAEGAHRVLAPWNAQRGAAQLTVRLVGIEDGCFQLLLEETTTSTHAPSAEPLEALGLTPREAEVLFWISQGKRSVEIATILGCKTRTVTKHVEHLFAKLGVETRTAAAVIALEILALSTRRFPNVEG